MTAEELFWIETSELRGQPAVKLSFCGCDVHLSPAAALRIARRIEQAAEQQQESEKKRRNLIG